MSQPNVFRRLLLSLVIFFRFIFDAAFAGRVLEDWQPKALPPTPEPKSVETLPAPPPPEPPKPAKLDHSPAMHVLAILQREGRLVDFLQEDIASFPDADVGAASRVVHEGCRKVLAEYFSIEPLRAEGEGARVTVPAGFDPATVRLTGNVAGQPPFAGTLRHHGWRVTEVRLPAPPAGQDANILAPAEVEL